MYPLTFDFDHLELIFGGRGKQRFGIFFRSAIYRSSRFLDRYQIIRFGLVVVEFLQILKCIVQLLRALFRRNALLSQILDLFLSN